MGLVRCYSLAMFGLANMLKILSSADPVRLLELLQMNISKGYHVSKIWRTTQCSMNDVHFALIKKDVLADHLVINIGPVSEQVL